MKKIYIFLGKSGAGKDTQIQLLAKKYQSSIIRTGDAVRRLAKTNKKIAQSIEKGEIIDNDTVNQIFIDEYNSADDNSTILSDGFPRVVEQAIWLDGYLSNHNGKIMQVFLLNISDEIAYFRLAKRARNDDKKETIDRRIELFSQLTSKTIEYYRAKNILIEIDSSGVIEQINQQIEAYFK